MPSDQTPWVVKGVSDDVRRKVKVYAAQHDMTMAQAIEAIVERVDLRHDMRLLDALLRMYRKLLEGDVQSASDLAKEIALDYSPEVERSEAALLGQTQLEVARKVRDMSPEGQQIILEAMNRMLEQHPTSGKAAPDE